MKIYRCNSGCNSKVVAHVTLMFPIDKEGEVDYNAEAKMVEETFVCSSCGEYARALTGHDLMKGKITKADSTKKNLIGEFTSKPRGQKTYGFRYSIADGTIDCPLALFDWEREFLGEFAEEEYKSSVLVLEVIDESPDCLEMRLENILEKTINTITARSDGVNCERRLNRIERELVESMIKRGI